MTGGKAILYFDGVCNLCNRTVQFIVKRDRKKIFRFASLQSAAGKKMLRLLGREGGMPPDSVVLEYEGRYYLRSSAVLKVAALLRGSLTLLLAGYMLPVAIRDMMYNFVAKRRYKWFGRRDECMVPTAELKERFLH